MANELEKTEETKETTDTAELEARIAALEKDNEALRKANTKASAEASQYKKAALEKDEALKAKMSEEERAKQEQLEREAATQEELKQLRAERNIAKFTSAAVAPDIGMDAETAKAFAEALNAGETDKVFEALRKFVTAHDKALKEKALLNNPMLPGGGTEKVMTQEEFDNMSYTETVKFKNEHPDLYAEFTKT